MIYTQEQFNQILSDIANNRIVGTLDLSYKVLNGFQARDIGVALQSNTSITKLLLNNNKINEGGAIALGNSMQYNFTLREVNLQGNFIQLASSTAQLNAALARNIAIAATSTASTSTTQSTTTTTSTSLPTTIASSSSSSASSSSADLTSASTSQSEKPTDPTTKQNPPEPSPTQKEPTTAEEEQPSPSPTQNEPTTIEEEQPSPSPTQKEPTTVEEEQPQPSSTQEESTTAEEEQPSASPTQSAVNPSPKPSQSATAAISTTTTTRKKIDTTRTTTKAKSTATTKASTPTTPTKESSTNYTPPTTPSNDGKGLLSGPNAALVLATPFAVLFLLLFAFAWAYKRYNVNGKKNRVRDSSVLDEEHYQQNPIFDGGNNTAIYMEPVPVGSNTYEEANKAKSTWNPAEYATGEKPAVPSRQDSGYMSTPNGSPEKAVYDVASTNGSPIYAAASPSSHYDAASPATIKTTSNPVYDIGGGPNETNTDQDGYLDVDVSPEVYDNMSNPNGDLMSSPGDKPKKENAKKGTATVNPTYASVNRDTREDKPSKNRHGFLAPKQTTKGNTKNKSERGTEPPTGFSK